MLTMLGTKRRCCDGLTRRETLRAGALSVFGGLTLPNLLRAESRPKPDATPGKAKSVVVLYLLGGAATQDMVDMKPNAPAEIRGEFKPIDTEVPGIRVCEHLPRLARWVGRSAIVRSLHHSSGCHNPLPSYSGYDAVLDNIVTTKDGYPPSMGSVCEYLGWGRRDLPAYVYMPCYLGWGQVIRRPGPYAGFLGRRFDPLFTECQPYVDDPAKEQPYHSQPLRGEPRLPYSNLATDMSVDRLNTRRGLLDQLDDELRRLDASRAVDTFDRDQSKALAILTSSQVKESFDLTREPDSLRERYGNTLFGQSALIARRLVEAGVRFVNVTWDCYWERLKLQFECWDTHARNFGVLRDYNLPYFDLTFSALMEDLEHRGLLAETLVVVMSEMGRTPRVNGNGGRDHWTHCYSVLLAGAGIRGGTVYGASDAQAAYVKDNPVTPADLCATIYHCLGIDPALTIRDFLARPIPIAHGGQPIADILA
jgi:hypothetical protein